MKPYFKNRFLALIGLAFASIPAAVSAQIVVSGETNDDTGFTVSSTDLLQTNLESTTNNISVNGPENSAIGGSPAFLNDGSFGAAGASGGICINGGSVTYILNTPGLSPGYEISEVNVYTGWNDEGRDGQNYTVSYSTVADPLTFVDISTVTRDEAGRFEKSGVTEGTSPNLLATGVKAIRITFNGQENGGVGYKEIDVIGSTPVVLPRNLTWDNGAATDFWNTIDVNWTGSIWDNARPDNAIFGSTGGVVNLGAIIAGSVSAGNAGTNFATVALSSGTLSASSLTVQGASSNEGFYGSNPTLSFDSDVVISGDAAIGRANLAVDGGNFTANRITSAPTSADWGRLVVSGGIVTATTGVDGSVNTPATFAIDLNGGELRTPSIRVADREFGSGNDAWLTFNGGTLKVIGGDHADYISTYGGGQNTFVASGGAIIDTNGFNIGILVNLTDAGGGGGLTKQGLGSLTLGGTYSYTGSTVVEAGTLALTTATLSDTAIVDVASTAVLDLPIGSTDTVADFLINGVSQGPGTWNAGNTGGRITGGSLFVAVEDPFQAWIAPFNVDPETAEGDPDNDGIANLLEYILQGGDPEVSNPGILPTLDASGLNFVFTFNRRAAATGTTQTFQYSADLGATPWIGLAIPGGPGVVVGDAVGGIEQVQITVPKGTKTKLFGRLQVTTP